MHIVLSHDTAEKILEYKRALIEGQISPGPRLAQVLRREAALAGFLGQDEEQLGNNRSFLKVLEDEDFVKLLYRTKCAVFMHEKDLSDHLWNRQELNVLLPGLHSVFTETNAIGNGSSTEHRYASPVEMNFYFLPAPCTTEAYSEPDDTILYQRPGSNVSEIADQQGDRWILNEQKYQALMREKLHTMLVHMEQYASENNQEVIIKIPALGCGVFASGLSSEDKAKLPGLIQGILRELLSQYSFPSLPYVFFMSDAATAISIQRAGSTELIVRPSKSGRGYFPMLADRERLFQDVELLPRETNGKEPILWLVGAGDGGSWPGNEGNIGGFTTEGVITCSSNLLQTITGRADAGYLDQADSCEFFPENALAEAKVKVVPPGPSLTLESSVVEEVVGGGGISSDVEQGNKMTLSFSFLPDRLLTAINKKQLGSEKALLLRRVFGTQESDLDLDALRDFLKQVAGNESWNRHRNLLWDQLIPRMIDMSFLVDELGYFRGDEFLDLRKELIVAVGRRGLERLFRSSSGVDLSGYRQEFLQAYQSIRHSDPRPHFGGGCFVPHKERRLDQVQRIIEGEQLSPIACGLLKKIDDATRSTGSVRPRGSF